MELSQAHAKQFFGLRTYVARMTRIVGAPRMFFREYAESGHLLLPVFALVLSGGFYACASLLVHACPQPMAALMIFFINAAGMPVLAAAMGYAVSRVILGCRIGFVRFFGIYAWAAAVVLPLACVPYLVLFAEVWRWWLIGAGLMIVCGLRRWQAMLVVVLTLAAMIYGYQWLSVQWR